MYEYINIKYLYSTLVKKKNLYSIDNIVLK